MIIYGVDGEHGNDTNSGIVNVISEEPLVIDWSNAKKTIQSVLDIIQPDDEDICYVRGKNDIGDEIVYKEGLTLINFSRCSNLNYEILENSYLRFITKFLNISKIIGVDIPKIKPPVSTRLILSPTGSNYEFYNFNFDLKNNSDIAQNLMYSADNPNQRRYWGFFDCVITNNSQGGHIIRIDGIAGDYLYIENLEYDDTNIRRMYIATAFNNYGRIILNNLKSNSLSEFFPISTYRSPTMINKCVYKSLELNFTSVGIIKDCIFDNLYFIRYGDGFILENSIIKGIFQLGQYFSRYIILENFKIKNNIFNNLVIYFDSAKQYIFENSIFMNTNNDFITLFGYDSTTIKDIIFKNCLFASDKPVDIPDENFINCVFNTDPLLVDPLNDDYSLQQDSPARKENWSGENPITEDLGAIPYIHKPILYTVYVIGNSGKIPLFIGIRDDNKIIELEIMYSNDNGETWNDCTIDYNTGMFGTAGETDIINDFLWNTAIDVPGIADTILRIRGYDGNEYSDYIYSSPIPIDNINIIPDVKWMTPLKFKLEDDKKLYFRMKRERD